jgi:histidinol-phosphate aminotransferase
MADELAPENVRKLVPYKPGKPIEELERELGIKDAVKLASNENPFGPSPSVAKAIAEAASVLHRYPDASTFELRSALSAAHEIPMDEICVGNGSNELIDLLCRTFLTASDHALFADPSFVCYELGCIAANAAYTKLPLRDRFFYDAGSMLDAIRPETKLIFVANPNNPTGTHLGKDGLQRLLREAPPRVIVVLDEAYVQFADAPDFQSALELRSLRERLVVLRTFSKAYALAALRVGYAVAPAPIVDYLNRVRAPFNVNSLAQRAALAALGDRAYVERYVETNRGERARVCEALNALGLRVVPSQANFVLVDFARPGAQVYDELLRAGVIVRPMPPPIDTCLRITVGAPRENDRLLDAVEALRRSS